MSGARDAWQSYERVAKTGWKNPLDADPIDPSEWEAEGEG